MCSGNSKNGNFFIYVMTDKRINMQLHLITFYYSKIAHSFLCKDISSNRYEFAPPQKKQTQKQKQGRQSGSDRRSKVQRGTHFLVTSNSVHGIRLHRLFSQYF